MTTPASICKWCFGEIFPADLIAHESKCELAQLMALRDRLVALPKEPNQAIYYDDLLGIITTARALKDLALRAPQTGGENDRQPV